MEYTNAQKLSAVLSEWARPAISQIATSKLCNLSMLKSFQQTMVGSGLVMVAHSEHPYLDGTRQRKYTESILDGEKNQFVV